MSWQEAERELALMMRVAREMGKGQDYIDAETARNVLHEELGRFGDYRKHYSLSDETRDVLLVHGRQDAAHAVVALASMGKRIDLCFRRLSGLIVFCTAAVIVAVWLL